jgi:hypothetical protein
VLICCWSSKGGAGTTVVAAALALRLGRRAPLGALLVDLAGDAPVALGLPDDPAGPGVTGWLDGGPSVPADALARVEVPVAPGVSLLPRGTRPFDASRANALATVLAADPRPVVVDAGVLRLLGDAPAPRLQVAAAVTATAAHSLLVTRACFMALRRAISAPVRPSGIVLVAEEGRALTAADVEQALGVPVCAQVSVTAAVARAVDAGLLAASLPRSLERELRHAA